MTWTSFLKPSTNSGRHRAVDQAGGQHFLLGRPRLALEEAARDLAGGVDLLLVVDGQREEVLAGLRAPARRRRWRARWSRHRWRGRRHRPGGQSLPVSSVSVSWPHSMDFLTTLNMSLPSYRRPDPLARRRATRGASPRGPRCLHVGGVPSGSEGPCGRWRSTGMRAHRRRRKARARRDGAPRSGQRRMPRRPISD